MAQTAGVTVITDIAQLHNALLAVRSKQSADSFLAYMLKGQLQALEMIESPKFVVSAFDLFLDALYNAVTKAGSEAEKLEVQRKAAIMTNSLLFFLEAKCIYTIAAIESRNKEIDQEEEARSKKLLEHACDLLSESAGAVLSGADKFTVALRVASKIGTTRNSQGEKPIFEVFAEFLGFTSAQRKEKLDNWNKISQLEKDSFNFHKAVFAKLERYKHLFGKSIVLSELVNRHKVHLINEALLDAFFKIFDTGVFAGYDFLYGSALGKYTFNPPEPPKLPKQPQPPQKPDMEEPRFFKGAYKEAMARYEGELEDYEKKRQKYEEKLQKRKAYEDVRANITKQFDDLEQYFAVGESVSGTTPRGVDGGTVTRPALESVPQSRACPKCGATASAGSKFCANCGSPLPPAVPVCAACGAELPAGSKFCGECGSKV
jgi:ribosomal protein L40E